MGPFAEDGRSHVSVPDTKKEMTAVSQEDLHEVIKERNELLSALGNAFIRVAELQKKIDELTEDLATAQRSAVAWKSEAEMWMRTVTEIREQEQRRAELRIREQMTRFRSRLPEDPSRDQRIALAIYDECAYLAAGKGE